MMGSLFIKNIKQECTASGKISTTDNSKQQIIHDNTNDICEEQFLNKGSWNDKSSAAAYTLSV